MFQGNVKGVSRKFKGHLKCQGCFKEVSRAFQVRGKSFSSSFKGVSRIFERSLKGVSGKF